MVYEMVRSVPIKPHTIQTRNLVHRPFACGKRKSEQRSNERGMLSGRRGIGNSLGSGEQDTGKKLLAGGSAGLTPKGGGALKM